MTVSEFKKYLIENNISDDAKITIGFPVEPATKEESDETISLVNPSSIENASIENKNYLIINI